MLPFLLTISFILHVFTFFWIMLLSLKLKRTNELETAPNDIQKEIEDMLQTYLTEIKDENEKLLNRIEKSGNTNNIVDSVPELNTQKQKEPKKEQISTTYKKPVSQTHEKVVKQMYQNNGSVPLKKKNASEPQQSKEYVPPQPSKEDEFVPSLTSQVFLLDEQGYTSNEIAQMLNKGRTEIELLLRFRQKSNENT